MLTSAGAKIPALGEVAQQVVGVGEVLQGRAGRGADAGEPAALGVEAAAEGGRAAQLLGVSYKTLLNKVKEYGIQVQT